MIFAAMKTARTKAGGGAIIANNVLMKFWRRPGAADPLQRAILGSFGRNTASSPIAGRNAHTW